MYIYIYTHTYIYIYIYIHTRAHTHMCYICEVAMTCICLQTCVTPLVTAQHNLRAGCCPEG